MNHKIGILLAIALALFGCKKATQEPAAPEPAPQKIQVDETPQAEPSAAPKAEPPKDVPLQAQPAAPEDKNFHADYTSKEFPEIHTEITTKDMPWGQIQHTSLLWSDDIIIFHEIPIFKDDTPALNKINAFLKGADQSFFTQKVLDSPWEYVYERHQHQTEEELKSEEKYNFTYTAEVTEYTDQYISVVLTMDWFMGGVNDIGYKNYTFDAKTGELLKLSDIYHQSEKDIQKMVTKAIRTHLDKNGLSSDLMEWGAIEKYKEYSFYLKDGIPHATFNKYEIAVGAAGAFDIELPKP